MEEELSVDNILGPDEIENLFQDDNIQEEPTPENNDDPSEDNKGDQGKDKEDKTTEVNPEELFHEDSPESVGSGKEVNEEKEDTSPEGQGTSPKKSFYSSIAKALKEEGIFPDLNDDDLSKATSPEAFRDLIDSQIRAGLDERQKRIDDALNAGIESSEVRRFENTIGFLDSIKEENITDEGDKGEKLRKDLIYQDFINRGYSKERASREVQKSFNAGTDIEDAKEALNSNKEFFKGKYDELISEAKREAAEEEESRRKQAEKLKTSILEDKNVFGDLSVDKSTRRKVYDNIAKPVYKDPETGEYYTTIQKYEMENRLDFLKNIGLVFTLTDGFKNLDGLIKGKVRKEVRKGLRELENTLNNTLRTSDGNLKYVSGVEEDPDSFIGKGWNLDV